MRRSRFNDGAVSNESNDYADNTKYDEKYIMPTNAVTPDFGTSSVYAAPAQEPGQAQTFNDPMLDTNRAVGRSALYSSPAPAERAVGYGNVVPEQPLPNAEAPRVFALRSDPTLYVYEYSDRLEYYRNTPTGMMLCNVEYKKNR